MVIQLVIRWFRYDLIAFGFKAYNIVLLTVIRKPELPLNQREGLP